MFKNIYKTLNLLLRQFPITYAQLKIPAINNRISHRCPLIVHLITAQCFGSARHILCQCMKPVKIIIPRECSRYPLIAFVLIGFSDPVYLTS